ncbi:uncharacterized protein LOC129790536 [Lutzomyia longipalpis]|uniref:uncharacterized protein LOC129790536 n=1 Tax=Lutzomyia longipalpis TaxID=7200 RepID=UPI0024845808|nr:uncharacterized protein LOC129790536 [Lutzomyia longipalpis]
MKYYPEQESDFDDYPASYYRDPSKFFAKPGFAAGFGAGFLPGLGALGFLHSLKWKVGAVTIIKIILKVILFKKIIKFIILLFLLIFTPSLFSIFTGGFGYGQGDNGLFRKFNYERSDNEKINDLAMFVLTSIDSYQNAKECRGQDEEYECRLNRMFKMIEAKYPFQKALQNYRKKINAEDQTEASPS